MNSIPTLDFHDGAFKLFIPTRALLNPTISVLGEVKWSTLQGNNYHLAKFTASPPISLSVLRARFEWGESYVLFRGLSFLEELRGVASPTLSTIQDAAYWNDALVVWFSRPDGCWCVMANRACSIPLFWSAWDDGVVCSNSIRHVAQGWPPIDSIGLAEALIFDTPLRDRTVWSGVRQVPAGYSLNVSVESVTLSKRMEFRIGGDVSGDLDELAEHAATLTRRAVQLAVKSEDHVLVPLSGGLDSRGIAVHLPPVRVATAVSYGHRHSLELVYGRATADSLGIPWKAYSLDRHHFKRPFLSVVEQSGVMTHRMHCHMAGTVLSSDSEEVVLLPGFMGDLVQGLRWRLIEQTTSASSCAWFLLEKYRQTENSFNRMFPPEVRDAVLHDLEWLVRDATALHEPIQFDEYYYFVERQPKLITHIFNALVTGHIRLSFPYMDGAWARFFLSLQGRFRYQRKLFRDSLSRACPRLGELPSLGTGGVVTSWSRSRRSAMLQRIGQLQQIVEKLSFGKLSFPDPCQTENVRHVLRTVLISKLRHSVRRLCDNGIVTAEVADEVCSARYRHLDAHAGFRLISLAEVIGIV